MALTCRSPGRRRVQPSSPHLFRPRAARAQRWRQLSRSSLSPGCLAGLECRGDSPAPGPGPAWTAALGLNQARTRLRAGLTLLDPAGASSGCPHLPNTPAQGGRRSGLRTPLPLLQSHHLLGIMPLPRALVGKARLRTLRLQAGHSAAGGPLRSPQWAPRLGKPVCGTPPPAHTEVTGHHACPWSRPLQGLLLGQAWAQLPGRTGAADSPTEQLPECGSHGWGGVGPGPGRPCGGSNPDSSG